MWKIISLSCSSASSSASSSSSSSSLSSQSSSSSSSLTAKQLSIRANGIKELSPGYPLATNRLQKVICELFYKIAAEIQPQDPEAIRFTKTALELNPPDSVKAQLLFILGDAFYMIKDQESIEQSLTYYVNGFNLESILDSDKVKFCLKIGNAYLARNQRGDEDLAIQHFEKGFQFKIDDFLISALHFGIGTAYKQKAENMKQK